MFPGLSLSPVVDRYVCLYRVSLCLVQQVSAGTYRDPGRGVCSGNVRVRDPTRVVHPGRVDRLYAVPGGFPGIRVLA